MVQKVLTTLFCLLSIFNLNAHPMNEDILKPLHTNTPLFESKSLCSREGQRIFLKMEALQPTGSFKIRGIGHLCSQLALDGAKRFVTSSGGNAGLAVIYAGNHLNIPVTVVLWNNIPEETRDKLRKQGAEILIYGNDWMEANAFAQTLCKEESVYFVHPFDHPLLWEGHASLIHEVKASDFKPDAVVVSVGGGGLLCGILQGLHEVGWNNVPVFTAETQGAASFAESVKAGKLITLDKIETIALSLGARRVCEQAFAWTQQHSLIPCVVSDSQSLNAVVQFLNDHRVLVEPACGAALALVYDKDLELMQYDNILVIVCGGCSTSLELLQKWKQDIEKQGGNS